LSQILTLKLGTIQGVRSKDLCGNGDILGDDLAQLHSRCILVVRGFPNAADNHR